MTFWDAFGFNGGGCGVHDNYELAQCVIFEQGLITRR